MTSVNHHSKFVSQEPARDRQVGASVAVRGYHCRALATACILVCGALLATEFREVTLSIKMAQKPNIIGSLGPKVLKYESFEGAGWGLGTRFGTPCQRQPPI